MSIVKFEFRDRNRFWELETTTFQESLNLLVGVSGVGKTRILKSLYAVCSAGAGKRGKLLFDCSWSLSVKIDSRTYTWSAKTCEGGRGEQSLLSVDDDGNMELLEFEGRRRTVYRHEEIRCDDESVHVLRQNDQITLNGKKLPKLKSTESLLSLLQEDDITPLNQALARVHMSSGSQFSTPIVPPGFREKTFKRFKGKSFESIQQETRIPFLLRALIFQENWPREFRRRVVDIYQEVFPDVQEVKIDVHSEFMPEREQGSLRMLDIAFKERDVDGWVASKSMSSGMRRTLLHILELALAPPGTVVLIDEYENSMGVNCLPAVTDQLLDRLGELQFIVTSHHPYVISNINKKHWMLVSRCGSSVKVTPAAQVPALDTCSSQDAFIQLINADEYQGGVQ